MFNIFKKKRNKDGQKNDFELICMALKEVMPQELRNMKIQMETKIDSLGIDSIKYINLFISLEDIIGKELEDIVDSVDLSTIVTVSDVVDLVNNFQTNG